AHVSDSTVNREFALLRAVLNAARRKWKLATAEIDWSMHRLAEPEPHERYLSREEVDALLKAAALHIRPIIACALYTGLRKANILALNWAQIDFDNRTITVYGKSKKPGGKKQTVPIATPLLAILLALGPRERGPVFTYTPTRRSRSAVAAPTMVADIKTGFRA